MSDDGDGEDEDAVVSVAANEPSAEPDEDGVCALDCESADDAVAAPLALATAVPEHVEVAGAEGGAEADGELVNWVLSVALAEGRDVAVSRADAEASEAVAPADDEPELDGEGDDDASALPFDDAVLQREAPAEIDKSDEAEAVFEVRDEGVSSAERVASGVCEVVALEAGDADVEKERTDCAVTALDAE